MANPSPPPAAADSADSAHKTRIEVALLTAGKPLDIRTLQRLLGEPAVDKPAVVAALDQLQADWQARGLQLAKTASGYQFITHPDCVDIIRRLKSERPPKLSRSLMEVLAIIVYRQPVTRGDIEKIRGIAVSSSQINFLEEQGWIEEVGQRETPGRPSLFATTKVLLDDLGVESLEDLPPLEEIEESLLAESDDDDADSGADDAGDSEGDDANTAAVQDDEAKQ